MGDVAMRLIGQQHKLASHTVPLQGRIEPLALHGEGARVVVILAVDEQNGRADLVRVHEGRHLGVGVWCLPDGALLRLEAEGSKGAVVGAGAGDAGGEEVGVRQQICGHKCAIRMPADGDPLMVSDAAADHVVHSGLGAVAQLFHVRVVCLDVALSNDWKRRAVHHSESAGQPQSGRQRPNAGERVRRLAELPGRLLGLELLGVGPHEDGQRAVPARVVARGQVESGVEGDPI
mmetsp:Transcript_4973/g.13900  ORF Transcript_4973/g.13900 Transcript_4973/m.13900 type:complete len:233 (+) Transcript_4973:163-861(+)